MNDEALLFTEEDEAVGPALDAEPWTVLIVDDEPEVHAVTRMVLDGVDFNGRKLDFLSAFSAAEARRVLAQRPDIAAILLDVVMESDHAGLDLVRYIRDDLGNEMVRIILRTGQPGQAPEREVVVRYDINDYKEKSELTAPKLFTAVFSALRAFEDLQKIETSRNGLERILAASGSLFRSRTMDRFLSGLPGQLDNALSIGGETFLAVRHPGKKGQERPLILAATGRFARFLHLSIDEALTADEARSVLGVFEGGRSVHGFDVHDIFFQGENGQQIVIHIEKSRNLSRIDLQLIDIFCSKAAVGLDNAYLYEQLRAATEATVHALAKAAEYKDDNTGAHVQRVSRYSSLLAHILFEEGRFPGQIDADFIALIGLASVLHDVGKVGIPDGILKKPARLTDEEWDFMHRHPDISLSILTDAAAMVDGRTYLSMAVEIAVAHHEHYDGNGYPHRLKGENIPLAARILAVVDVFDALTSRRPYKNPWPLEEALALIGDEAGRQFDPIVAQAFIKGVQGGLIAVETI